MSEVYSYNRIFSQGNASYRLYQPFIAQSFVEYLFQVANLFQLWYIY